ncbi:lipocalin family protein [Polaribacter butkevichii]|uniref:Uncharacterized protein n=1 Tax=Polaribacter butkevichii TaxID=218490 RepID=A0A2P6CBZ1_9FLAO|nr:lipocalin family protein [Polaribacter butkevichii]PQJ72424.1 hypothetical protein BTO14_03780 [Polaribacter butkevichii]
MKKILCIVLLLTAMIGCKSTSTVNTKLDNKTERSLKGNFTITAVNYPGSDYLKVTSFNLADSKCFIGSNWSFISNNNKGEMTLNSPSTSCKDFSSPITWYVNKEGNFVLKIINDYKAKEVNNGFVLKLTNLTPTSFDLVDKINVAGQEKSITYTFQQTNQ